MQIPEQFTRAIVKDTEFIPEARIIGHCAHCIPVCMSWCDVLRGQGGQVWQDQLGDKPPYPTGPGTLVIAFSAQAEIGFDLAAGWDPPPYVVDLYYEFRWMTSGLPDWPPARSRKLLDALTFFGLSGIDAVEKRGMIDLVLRGGPWSTEERQAILEYCESDVKATCQLLEVMGPKIHWGQALLRGRYAAAEARTRLIGTPIDKELHKRFQQYWEPIGDRLIAEIDKDYHVYEGREFKQELFAQYLAKEGISDWPTTPTGLLETSDETFEDLSDVYPQLKPLRHLRQSRSGLRLHTENIDEDGRSRCNLRPFGSSTGRNQPSSKEFIFGNPSWHRGVVKPPEGYGLAEIDYTGQEVAVAAYHSRDRNMMDAYESDDAYLWLAKKSGLIPPDATKQSHRAEREIYKTAFLAMNYGISPESLGVRINRSTLFARHLIELHRDLFRDYWRWSDLVVNHATLFGWQSSVLGWIFRLPPNPRPNALRNFPIQSAGAEMMRLAHCLATENGIQVCAPIHDAFVIEAPLANLDREIERMRSYMAEASKVVLNGFEVFTDVKVIRYPDRYSSAKGQPMWNLVMRLLEEVETENTVADVFSPAENAALPVSI